jgi:hypothetical protein
MNYVKYVSQRNTTSNITQFFTKFDPASPVVIRAGDPLPLNITAFMDYAVSPPESGQFMPYDKAIYVNYTMINAPGLVGSVKPSSVGEWPTNMI